MINISQLASFFRSFKSLLFRLDTSCFIGDYKSWKEAKKLCTGYDSPEILEKCRLSLLKVKNGEAVYERDSVLFNKIEYSWPLLSGLMLTAAHNNGNLNVLDFGGSLGSTYYQNKKFLDQLPNVSWNIVEQKHFVEVGKNCFEDSRLKFCDNIEESLKANRSNIILLSGVIMYLKNPYGFIKEIVSHGIDYILIDRTLLLSDGEDLLTIQKVPKEIFPVSYPCWFLNKDKLLEIFKLKYELIEEFNSIDQSSEIKNSISVGFLFKKI